MSNHPDNVLRNGGPHNEGPESFAPNLRDYFAMNAPLDRVLELQKRREYPSGNGFIIEKTPISQEQARYAFADIMIRSRTANFK
jgi:hypothetical protein